MASCLMRVLCTVLKMSGAQHPGPKNWVFHIKTVWGAEKGITTVGAHEHSEVANGGESINYLATKRNVKLVALRSVQP